jgi:hypothetical protein
MIAANLKQALTHMAEIATACGRTPESVQLVAVSKTHPMALIREAFEAGQVDFGENRVQELTDKQPELPEARWHLIGSLQRNKVKYIAPFVHMIHSVDSLALAQEIQKHAAKYDRVIQVLLQINISEEDSKSGLNEAGAEAILALRSEMPNLAFTGLMGMAAFTDDEALIRSQFRRLRVAKEDFAARFFPGGEFQHLSMGMSGDYPIAIEEGATLVRIGSAIFGSR